jgi:hypothetical protein
MSWAWTRKKAATVIPIAIMRLRMFLSLSYATN